MAVLTVLSSSRAGMTPDLVGAAVAAAGGGDKWLGTGNEMLFINNGGGSPITLTLNYGVGGTIDGQTLPNRTISIGAGKSQIIGPFGVSLYNDSNGYVNISYSGVTSVVVAPFKMGN